MEDRNPVGVTVAQRRERRRSETRNKSRRSDGDIKERNRGKKTSTILSTNYQSGKPERQAETGDAP